MYEITVEGGFCAIHRLRYADGALEPSHGHDWRVTVSLRSAELDECGLVADFTEVQTQLNAITDHLHHTDLNEHEWFRGSSPSAERVARVVYERLATCSIWGEKLHAVLVVEAVGCSACYVRGKGTTSSA